jgi:glycosyltransferase involved in cell wall biosynthesis
MHVMRIGVLTTSFPRSDRDSAGAFVLGMSRGLVAAGHSVEVLAPEPRERDACMQWPGIRVQHVPYLRPRALQRTFYGAGVPDNLARDPLAWLGLAPFSAALVRAARAHAHDWQALISHWALPCALAASCVKRHGPHIAVLHSADLHLLERLPMRSTWAARIARDADALWFVTEPQRRAFLDWLPRSVSKPCTTVCPMGIELPIRELSDTLERADFRRSQRLHDFTSLVLSRLVPIKGIDTAVRAAALGGMSLLIAGEGPERSRLEHLATTCGARVRFLGQIAGADKQAWLSAADAFVLPSRQLANGRSEGLPTALLEAMAHGLPVVASKLSGIDSLLAANGLADCLVPANDPAALCTALQALRDDPARAHRSASAGRKLAEQFSWSRVTAKMLALIAHG